MAKKKYFNLVLALFVLSLKAQNVPFEKQYFEDRKEEFRLALTSLQTGTDFYVQGRKEFEDFAKHYLIRNHHYPVSVHDYGNSGNSYFKNAIAHLINANRFNPNNAEVNYMLGIMYFLTDPNHPETFKCLDKAFRLNPEGDIVFWLAWYHHINSNWQSAIKEYEDYIQILMQRPKVNQAHIDDVKKKIEECKVGIELSKNPDRVFVENLGPNINSEYAEYGASITADESSIFFTSRRAGTTGGNKDESDNQYLEDVYCANRIKNKWQKPVQLNKKVNTEGHDALAGLSSDGSKLFIYRFSAMDGGDIYESRLSGNDWELPKPLNKYVNTKFHESSVSLSYDGKHLFFVSDKETGYGENDIYVSDIDINGEWGVPHNLGPIINTKYSEDGIYVHPDGVTIYFSSKGHNTMGGFDIFKSTFVDNAWTKPVNLGSPINSPNDDVFFVVSASGNHAYFSSSKPGGYGDKDLYKIIFLGPEKKPILNTQDQLISTSAVSLNSYKLEEQVNTNVSKVTILKGIIKDEISGKSLEAEIELNDLEKNINLAIFQSNSATGKYLVSLPSGKNYGITVKCEGYLFHSENFNLPKTTDYQEVTLDFNLKKIEIGKTVVLKNIFFDSGEFTLKQESINELDKLFVLLKENSKVKIEISSHTDNVGGEEANKKLSNKRSDAVYEYLANKGVSKQRLSTKGYGEQKPLVKNDTEEGRKTNRRTEFKITDK